MADRFAIARHAATRCASAAFPTVTLWNRLEGRPRTRGFDRALRAEVRDALWMLTRQWQIGRVPRRRRRLAGASPSSTSRPRAARPATRPRRRRRGALRRRRRRWRRRSSGGRCRCMRRRARDRARPAAADGPPVAEADRSRSATTGRRSSTRTRSPLPDPAALAGRAIASRTPRLADVRRGGGAADGRRAAVPAPARRPRQPRLRRHRRHRRRPTRPRSTTLAARFVRWFDRLIAPAARRRRRVAARAARVPLRLLGAATGGREGAAPPRSTQAAPRLVQLRRRPRGRAPRRPAGGRRAPAR